MKNITFLIGCILIALAAADATARHCDAARRFCYATYMISNERLGAYLPTVVTPVAAYCSNASNVGFATALFAKLNDSRPSYALGDLLFRDFPGEQLRIGTGVPPTAGAAAERTFWVHATVTQVCDLDALHCRYAAGYNTPSTIAIPGMTRYTTSDNVPADVIAPLPPAFYVGRWKGDCPAANDTVSPLATMPPPDCVTYVGAAGAFRLCVPQLAEQLLAASPMCIAHGAFTFCAITPPAAMTADTVPPDTALGPAIVPGLFFTSHPLLGAVQVTSAGGAASTSGASSLESMMALLLVYF